MKTLLLGVFLSANALAWGPTGHRAVGQIAEKYLDLEVLVKIKKIAKGSSLARISTWPDEIKSEPQTYQHTYNWHFTDWPDEMHEHNEETSAGTLIKSINEQLATLKDPAAADDKKEFALKFLVHLIGDLHMPLHVGNGVDQGGNFCKVMFQGKPTNLHAVWDEGMIDFTKLSFIELANFVSQGRDVADFKAWKTGTPLDWALESKILRGEIYPADVVAPVAPTTTRQYCRKDTPVSTAEMPNLGYAYSYQFMPVVEKRIYQAGLRLAVLLNTTLK